jgi:glycosyltransferase involved in cell wall biosynthesis
MHPPKQVSVIVPCRNEVDHIDRFLDCLFHQKLPAGSDLEVLLADGLSDDGTRERIERRRRAGLRLRIIDNPKRIVSAGLNAAIREARGEVILRMDVHTIYARDYIAECLRALHQSRADNVGGPWIAAGSGYLSKAIALAFASRFVSGGGRAHDPAYEGYLDTVYLGCWRREAFEKYGLFDEELVRSQDNELNLRIQRGGGRIWQTPRIRSRYAPRPSLRQLFRQYVQYGYWKVRVIRKHKIPASPRQIVPGGFLACLLTLAAASPLSDPAWELLLGLAGLYAAVSFVFSVGLCGSPSRWRYLPVMPVVFAAYQFGFGYGFLQGVADFIVLRKAAGARFTALTRSPPALHQK